MNTYRVTYATKSLENGGETGCTDIIEISENAARKAFKECYRQDGYSIINIELIAENVNASKAQEFKALAQIREIVSTLGPDSYVGTAFKGCFEIAECNIECDFADNLFERAEIAAGRASDFEDECVKLKIELERARKDANASIAAMKQAQEQQTEEHDRLEEYVISEQQAQQRADSAETDLHFAKMEIIELKARLYDYMVTAS